MAEIAADIAQVGGAITSEQFPACLFAFDAEFHNLKQLKHNCTTHVFTFSCAALHSPRFQIFNAGWLLL